MDEDQNEPAGAKKPNRDAELSKKKKVREAATKICQTAEKAFRGQNDRDEAALDHWDAFNVTLSDRQFYHGTSEICTPFVRDAVQARQTRFSNQLFPENQKHIEAVGPGDTPYATVSLLEHYIHKLKFKSNVVDPLLINGDLEGQYSLYVSWEKCTRYVTSRIKRPVEDEEGNELPAEPVDDMEEETEVVDSGPVVEVLSDADIVVFPATAQSIEQALELGGGVAIKRRWTEGEIKRRAANKEIGSTEADALLEAMSSLEKEGKDVPKAQGEAAGVKIQRGSKVAIVYEVWCKLKVEDQRRICRVLWAGNDTFLSIKRNPYWCDIVPVISCAVDKTSGVFKGKAPVAAVLDFHILANDTVNEGADSGHFSLLPIIMTDPIKNPKIGSMVLAPAAIWETDPQSTQFAKFPEMWKDAAERVMEMRSQIFQTLGVNPAMIPGTTGKNRKMNQAEIAQEQQVDLLTTADAVTVLEQGVLTPLLTLILELDHQFREDSILIRSFGPVGQKMKMEELDPQQIDRKVEFRWYGVEAAKTASKLQQQIAGVNVLTKVPPQTHPDHDLNLAPVLSQIVENLFGPVLAPEIFKPKDVISVDPHVENEMMEHGFDTPIHPADNDVQHLQVHVQAMRGGDPHGTVRKHIAMHQKAAQAKAEQQMRAAMPQQGQAPGGGPQPGGQPRPPQSQPGAPGQIHPDQMAAAGDPSTMPRKE
jgi:hypothetical protein